MRVPLSLVHLSSRCFRCQAKGGRSLLLHDNSIRPVTWYRANSTTRPHRYTPRRACLYVPGNDERKLQKIPSLGADCVVMDCEDGVALNRKAEARSTIRKVLDTLDFGRTEPCVRVNSVDSGLTEDDLNEVLKASNVPPTFMLPKVESTEHIKLVSDIVTTRLRERGHSSKVNLIIFVESAMAMLNLRETCAFGQDLTNSEQSLLRLDGVVFGSDDFCADIGATRTDDALELLYARQHVVLVTKAFGLQAIDIVQINFKDKEGLKKQALEGAGMGFTGKQCIHPSQVSVVQEAFAPSEAKVEWASELIKAFEEHQQSGKGAFTFRCAMIDMPLLRQAQNVMELAHSVNLKTS